MTTNGVAETPEQEASASSAVQSQARTRRQAMQAFSDLPRVRGTIAEDGQLRARIEVARILGDAVDEHVSERTLAERLAERGMELDLAVELARRSLANDADPALRHALCGWLEGLGEPALAASELRKLVDPSTPERAAQLLVRIGVLHARARDVHGAEEALAEAANLDPADALALELLGAVAGWAHTEDDDEDAPSGDRTGTRASSEAYVQAARRRAARGEADVELEDLLRAFELDDANPMAAAALSVAYATRGRPVAADEVLRAHARSLALRGALADAASVHERRRDAAASSGDLARAFGAVLDEKLDAHLDGPGAEVVEHWLVRAGAFEAVAVRLELQAEAAQGKAAGARWAELGRLLSGPLASPERATRAYARSVAAFPGDHDTLHALRVLSQHGGQEDWLVEGLVRAAMGGDAWGAVDDGELRAFAARELSTHAENRSLVVLWAWATRVLASLAPDDARARVSLPRANEIWSSHQAELVELERHASEAGDGGRATALAALATALDGVPEASAKLLDVLTALHALRPEDDAVLHAILRVGERIGSFDRVAATCLAALERRPDDRRSAVERVTALRRAGELRTSADAAAELLDGAPSVWTVSVAWITAAVGGDRPTRARALAALATSSAPAFSSVIAAVAADELAATGDYVAARRAAEAACHADPESARSLRALAGLVLSSEGRVATTAIERAVAESFASSGMCARLAQAYEQLDEPEKALAWTRRLVALRPGDAGVVQMLLERALRASDAGAIVDVLGWLVPQPQPARATAEKIAPALIALVARDPSAASAMAQRALDVLGPRHEGLRNAIQSVANATGEPLLRARLTERWIATGAPAASVGPLLLSLAEDYRAAEDTERELLAYGRAARAGADLRPARARLAELGAVGKSGDGEMAHLEARAELALADDDAPSAARALRELGAAYWDMADDRPRAVQCWLRAAELRGGQGYETLRHDLTRFADAQYAMDCLSELAAREGHRARSGILACEAARAAVALRAYPQALTLAQTALERHPGHAEALEAAELACAALGRVREMSSLYDQVARGSRGRFGRRAAHHRAARFFEASNAPMLALKHAAQAFIAVPAEGTTLALLTRTAKIAKRPAVAARTVEHVADLSRHRGIRAAWLLRAVQLAGDDLDGARQRFELLLKAAVLEPQPGTLGALASATRALLLLAPDESETLSLRLTRANDAMARKLEGPDGARIGIAFAKIALEAFGDPEWGWRAIERAIGADADVDEYLELTSSAALLGGASIAGASLARVMAECEKPYANIGHALLRLSADVADHAGERELGARFLVMAAEKEPDDDALVARADAATEALGDAALAARLSKKVGAFRRTEALRALAAATLAKGEGQVAVTHLERASVLAPPEVREEVAAELARAMQAVGRGEEVLLRELNEPGIDADERSRRWSELASIRTERGDLSGATDALLQAATEAPTDERWSAVEASAEASGRDHIRVDALEHLVARATGAARVELQKRLARVEAGRGSLGSAETIWRAIWEANPDDNEADVAIEALLTSRQNHDELAAHLDRRAARLASDPHAVETRRAVRLRRVAILEQRLGRVEDAAVELEKLLSEFPGNASALRYLADLRERQGLPAKALPVLEQLVLRTTDEAERDAFAVRRIRALLALGENERARHAAIELGEASASATVYEVRVDVARALADPRLLGAALADLARVSTEDALVRSDMLIEAAQAAARIGDNDASRERAQEAARLAPQSPSTQLFARGLEYRWRGAGTASDAQATLAALAPVATAEALEPEDIALGAFLLAEAKDVLEPGSGEALLRDALGQVGPQPLIALGLAERSAATLRPREALAFYLQATAGNLLGLRRPALVALAAAEVARALGDHPAEAHFLEEAQRDPGHRKMALRALADVEARAGNVAASRAALRRLASVLEGGERADVLADLARSLFASARPADRIEGDRTMREAIAADPARSAALRAELDGYRARQPEPPPATASVPSRAMPAPAENENELVAQARARLRTGDPSEAVDVLLGALRDGSLEAADVLDEWFSRERSRTAELIKIRRQAVELAPGDLRRLAKLRDVAALDKNVNWVRAIDHVLRAFDAGAGPLPAPPLSAQNAQPGMLTLLTRHSREPAGEALGQVWDGAGAVFSKPPTAYGMTGLERVVPGPMSPLSRLYEVTLRLLDMPRFPLFHLRTQDVHPTFSIALLGNPSAILSVDARDDSKAVRWAMGRALAAVMPENALLLGLPESDARALYDVLVAAFGPPGRAVARDHAHVAELLWQTLAPRHQRRLQELFAGPTEASFELVLERARQSGRRVGMFLTGDFAHAAREVLAEHGALDALGDGTLETAGGLARACEALPALADLYRLALRPEYADARWCYPPQAASRPSSGHVPVV